MKIVNILGGLGNQLFQYAFAIALQKRFPEEVVKLNIGCLKGYPLHNGYELNKLLEMKLQLCTVYDLIKVAYPWVSWRVWKYGHKILPNRKSMLLEKDIKGEIDWNKLENIKYFEGYWQSMNIIDNAKDEIRSAITFPVFTEQKNKVLASDMSQSDYAFIHIRKGDYVNNSLYNGICTDKYYYEGLRILIEVYGFKKLIIFSNDIDSCRYLFDNDLCHNCEKIYVDWNKGRDSFRDMQLMTMCKGALIANSSFSWWGAWLGYTKVVLCPTRWDNSNNNHFNLIPDEWIPIL